MKNRIYVIMACCSLFLLTANVSKAAFPVKKDALKTESAAPAPPSADLVAAVATATTNEQATETKAAKKHSFFSRIAQKIAKAERDVIPQAAYIILAIFALGWLAMGLNDNFEGINWLISLLLYLIFYLPGLIYTLIMMGDYY